MATLPLKVGSREANSEIPENLVEDIALVFLQIQIFCNKEQGIVGRKGY